MTNAILEQVIDPTVVEEQAKAAIAPVVQTIVRDQLKAYFAGDSFAELVRSEALRQAEAAIAPLKNNFNGNGVLPQTEPTTIEAEVLEEMPMPMTASPAIETEAELRMVLPRNIKAGLIKNTRANLNKALPDGITERRLYLEAIVSGSESGKVWLDRLCKEIESKFGMPDAGKQPTYQTYLGMARKLLGELTATGT